MSFRRQLSQRHGRPQRHGHTKEHWSGCEHVHLIWTSQVLSLLKELGQIAEQARLCERGNYLWHERLPTCGFTDQCPTIHSPWDHTVINTLLYVLCDIITIVHSFITGPCKLKSCWKSSFSVKSAGIKKQKLGSVILTRLVSLICAGNFWRERDVILAPLFSLHLARTA